MGLQFGEIVGGATFGRLFLLTLGAAFNLFALFLLSCLFFLALCERRLTSRHIDPPR